MTDLQKMALHLLLKEAYDLGLHDVAQDIYNEFMRAAMDDYHARVRAWQKDMLERMRGALGKGETPDLYTTPGQYAKFVMGVPPVTDPIAKVAIDGFRYKAFEPYMNHTATQDIMIERPDYSFKAVHGVGSQSKKKDS